MIFSSHQPGLLPHLGFWRKMQLADRWAHNASVEFSRRNFQHRVMIGTGDHSEWLTLPVERRDHVRIADIRIQQVNVRKLMAKLELKYRLTPYWEQIELQILDIFRAIRPGMKLVEVTLPLIEVMKSALDITTEIVDLDPVYGTPSKKIAVRTRQAGCNVYIAGPSGKKYLDATPFEEGGIEIQYSDPVPDCLYKNRSILSAFCDLGPGCLEKVYGAEEE